MTPEAARQLLADADIVCSATEVQSAIARIGAEIAAELAEACPLVLTVMGGGLVFAGQLLPRLTFPLECDYLHATRYGDDAVGAQLKWRVEPCAPVSGRTVLVLDDILDEGITLAAIKSRLLDMGAARCLLAVLAVKDTGRPKPVNADFAGLRLPDRFVFGCGMDVKGVWRNLPAIYAMKASGAA